MFSGRKRNRSALKCAHCGAEFPRRACAGLFCGDDCRIEHEAHLENARFELKAAGFVVHPEAPNLWVKDGAAISVEHAKNVGMARAMEIHAMHVEGIQLAQQNQS